MSKLKTWLLDHEKALLPVILLAVILIWFLPEYFYKGAVTLFLGFKFYEIWTDKSATSMLKTLTAKPVSANNAPTTPAS